MPFRMLPVIALAVACERVQPPDVPPDDTASATPDAPPRPPDGMCQIAVECYGSILDEPKAPCSMQVYDGIGQQLYDGDAGVELRGRSSLDFPKPQYSVELRDHTELPVWPGATWRYLDDGTDPGSGWTALDHDDSGWSEGRAPLGYEAGYLQTEVTPQATTWLRRVFDVGSFPEVTLLEIGLKSSEGVTVYLNGAEVHRSDVGLGTWEPVDVDAGLLVDGDNLLAVEIRRSEPDDGEMRFDLYTEATGYPRSVNLLGMGGEDDWILNGQYVDRVLFRNRLAFDLFQSFGGKDRYATETWFCELDLNGEYQGIYTLGEKLDRDDDRIDLKLANTPGDSFVVKLDDEPGLHPSPISYGTWQLVWPEDDPDAATAVDALLTRLDEAVLGPDPADPDTGIFSIIDLDSAVDWVLINELMKNRDAYFLSVWMWRDDGGLLHFAPWDLDLSMGYPYTDCGAEGWASRRYTDDDGELRDVRFIQAFAEVPAFRDRLAERWGELRQDLLAEDRILALVDRYDASLAPALGRNLERWPIEDIAFSFGGVDNWLCPVSSYAEEHARVLEFLSDRLKWMDEHIREF